MNIKKIQSVVFGALLSVGVCGMHAGSCAMTMEEACSALDLTCNQQNVDIQGVSNETLKIVAIS